jgi:hypothetical protein
MKQIHVLSNVALWVAAIVDVSNYMAGIDANLDPKAMKALLDSAAALAKP